MILASEWGSVKPLVRQGQKTAQYYALYEHCCFNSILLWLFECYESRITQ